MNKKSTLQSILPLFFYFKKNRVSVIYTTLTNANIIAILVGKLLNIKIIIREANTSKEYNKTKKNLVDMTSTMLCKLVYNHCYKCIAISENVKNDLLHFTNCNNNKIHVIYNPVIIIDNKVDAKVDLLYFNIAIVSRLNNQKNIFTISEIIKIFAKKKLNVKFHFFGEGEEIGLLENINADFKVNIIELHGFDISYYSYVKYMQMFIHLPLWEGLGNSVLEVFNSGIPMILSDIESGYSELIKQNMPNIHYFHPTKSVLPVTELLLDYIHFNINIDTQRQKLNLPVEQTFKQYRDLAN